MIKKYFQKNSKRDGGFTIIEMMIAIAIFLIVVVIGMGALLNTNLIHRKTQDMRSIMDSLSFIMEDMSRNIRTGYEYNSDGDSISFKHFDNVSMEEQIWEYSIAVDSIQKIIDEGTPVKLNPEEITFEYGSGFTVTGEDPTDYFQPFVTIRLVGKITYKGVDTPFSLQTSVSQRLIDIAP